MNIMLRYTVVWEALCFKSDDHNCLQFVLLNKLHYALSHLTLAQMQWNTLVKLQLCVGHVYQIVLRNTYREMDARTRDSTSVKACKKAVFGEESEYLQLILFFSFYLFSSCFLCCDEVTVWGCGFTLFDNTGGAKVGMPYRAFSLCCWRPCSTKWSQWWEKFPCFRVDFLKNDSWFLRCK